MKDISNIAYIQNKYICKRIYPKKDISIENMYKKICFHYRKMKCIPLSVYCDNYVNFPLLHVSAKSPF